MSKMAELWEAAQPDIQEAAMYEYERELQDEKAKEDEAYNIYMQGGIPCGSKELNIVHSDTDMNSKSGQSRSIRLRRRRSSGK